jgi:hypothetical protein
MARLHWRTAVNGDFGTASDWTTGTVPGASDNAILDAKGANFAVTADTSEDVDSLTLASNAILDITGGTFTTGAVTNAGDILVNATIVHENTVFSVDGAVVNTGSIRIASADQDTAALLIGAGGVTLGGGGQVVMSGAATIVGGAATDVLTNVDNTISGFGDIGNGRMTLVNEAAGVIDASGSDKHTLTLYTGGETLTNAGTLEATGVGPLVIADTVIAGTGGTILAAGTLSNDVSVDLQDDTTVIGGVLDAQAKGDTIYILSGSSVTADSVTGAGTIYAFGSLIFDKSTTLSGGGQIFSGSIGGTSTGVMLTNVDDVIEGVGKLGNNSLILVNDAAGIIEASAGGSLVIGTGTNTIVNAGLIEAGFGDVVGTGTITSAVYNTGVLAAKNGTLTITSVVDNTGTLEASGGTLRINAAVTGSVSG